MGGVDLVPTFFKFAGLDLPWKMHGHDLTPLLKDPRSTREEPVLLTFTGRNYGSDTDQVPPDSASLDPGGVPWWVFLVKGRYKYIRSLVEGEIEELYDLRSDPDELTNLALDPTHAKRLKRFRGALVDELERTDAGMVKTLPAVKQ